MTTVVPTSEEDPALAVVRFTAEMSWADAGAEVAEGQVNRLYIEAQESMVQNRWLDLASLMLTSADVIFSKASEKDIECIYTIICDLVKRPESTEQVHQIAELISTKVVQHPNDKPQLRLMILFNLYNVLENPYSQFFVYMKALNLALNGKVTEHMVPSFKRISTFMREWNLGVKDKRDLFIAVANVLKDAKSSARDFFNFLVKYLETFSGADASLSEAKEEAVRAVIEFVKSPDVFQGGLLDMPAVAQLENDPKYAPAYQLLQIFSTQRLDAYLSFQSSNSDLLTSYGLLHEDCVAKMRLMSLVDLGRTSGSGQIPFSSIKETLQIEDNEVESWVVRAITAKLLDCRIDQINEVVVISRCTERVFGLREWQSLRTKLATWRVTIRPAFITLFWYLTWCFSPLLCLLTIKSEKAIQLLKIPYECYVAEEEFGYPPFLFMLPWWMICFFLNTNKLAG